MRRHGELKYNDINKVATDYLSFMSCHPQQRLNTFQMNWFLLCNTFQMPSISYLKMTKTLCQFVDEDHQEFVTFPSIYNHLIHWFQHKCEMSQLPFFILLLISLPLQVIPQNHQTADERTVLLKLKQQLGHPPSLQSWNSTSSPCDWPEIFCTGNSVTEILLPNKNITQKIPATICDLKNLTTLDLSRNFIPGEFPRQLYNCTKLQVLNLSLNYFVGPIPDDIDRISGLRFLRLGYNHFSGDIPPAIGRLSELQELNLYGNEFNGTFPVEIGNLSNLQTLGLTYNDMFVPAKIPVEFGKLKNLRTLHFRETNLIGEIPDCLNNLSSLEFLDLSRNHLEGKIPSWVFTLKNLTRLYLFHNRLSGKIPEAVETLNLVEIDLSMNNLTGLVPEDFGKLQNLQLLSLFSNQLTGEIPSSISLTPNLKYFRVYDNNLSGVLPPELGLHSKLEEVTGCVMKLGWTLMRDQKGLSTLPNLFKKVKQQSILLPRKLKMVPGCFLIKEEKSGRRQRVEMTCPLRFDFGVVLGQKVECGKKVGGRSKKGDGGSDLGGEIVCSDFGPNMDSHSLAVSGPNEGFSNVSTVGKSNPLKDSGIGQFFIDLGTVVETLPNISKRSSERDSCLSIKSHSMKLRNSKDNFKFSLIIEDELVKVIETAVGLGMDFNGKEVGMAEIFAEERRKKKLGM
ncbi:hypothetical protein LWI29_023901 [Acer saccharum]|uniref:Leucine-rich repeat-containing N-terminal plant-type domain-containing protein n=1 Tax=Acer saccharum TaxID=4024 RepID=A0AA39SYK8_ACESA|nr:hypothetical protein LWI29_023901 [Acer saccharum]